MNTLVEFHGVSKSYGGQPVLENLSFTLRQGEVVVFLGPSGCGKTTVLNIATGVTSATAGKVDMNTRRLGYVFQEPRLLPWKTALANIRFGMAEPSDEMAQSFLKKVGLTHAGNSFPRQLSGGMKQRVSIARALAANPELILMDEPFSALDPQIKRGLQNDVIRIIEDFRTGVLYVTHDYWEAVTMADRIILLDCAGKGSGAEMHLEVPRFRRYDGYKQEKINEI
ncbi:hypothetical protein SporoP37_12235 [Sporosarcina sp. P37]|uniref:ABC transporter ATP-binding protein n=1 Tax=Sporosarcina sp. P35 TaxID=2048246 RepID=UPI000A179B67|nr:MULTISPECIES: ABC transporter ATP-binding protein [unclassified Sporosarcina]ARK25347.1 hypothetical protein SporoP37_12235 [Sporosarcina sp. P37]